MYFKGLIDVIQFPERNQVYETFGTADSQCRLKTNISYRPQIKRLLDGA